MTTPNIEPEIKEPVKSDAVSEQDDERRRRWLLLLLLLLLLVCCCVGLLFARYLAKPQPFPDLLPQQVSKNINYPPTYKFMITGVDKPVGVAVSPDNQRIYVAESAGNRMVKMFDRAGNLIKAFAPPGTDKANREPHYIAVDASGRVFLVERTSNAIDIFDADGKFIDAIIAPDMTLKKYLSKNIPGGLPTNTVITHYEGINRMLSYQSPGLAVETMKIPATDTQWSPLGIRFDKQGDLMYTDMTSEKHSIHIIPAADLNGPFINFNPQIKSFGEQGSGNSQMDFPNSVVLDSKGNYYVSDGNNARILVWTPDLKYKTMFGFGANNAGTLNLPRGLWMDQKDRLHVVDAVGATIRVYDVSSGTEPTFLYTFGEYGVTEGLFSYPFDICIDGTGRLYIADRENDRVQIWSY